jgi:hypothetical protein
VRWPYLAPARQTWRPHPQWLPPALSTTTDLPLHSPTHPILSAHLCRPLLAVCRPG